MKTCWAVPLVAAALLAGGGCSSRPGGVVAEVDAAPEVRPPDPDLLGPDLFQEVAKSAGIDFTYHNGEEVKPPHLSILESLGGGVALIDYDGDGLLDIYIPGGGYFAGAGNREIRGHAGRLYKNLGGWKFKDVTKEVGLDTLAGGAPWFYSHAAAVADFNRDGWPDLLVTGWGRIALFQNVPDGKGGRKFVDVSAKAGLDKGITWATSVDVSAKAGLDKGITWATSAAWADLDGDGWPDLYVCQYVDWSFANNPKCDYDGKTADVCPPKRFRGLPHKLFRNNGDGTFTDVSVEAGLRKGGDGTSKGLGVVIVDLNGDGKPDIYVANDTVDNFLYVNHSTPGHIRLQEDGVLDGVARDNNGMPNGSMGVDAGDYDGSGVPALWVTNYENELHALYRNLCNKDRVYFLFNTQATGIAAIGQKHVGWGTGFVDVDHHGWEDLMIVDGHAIRFPGSAPRLQKPVLMRNRTGHFRDITPRGGPYFREQHLARGLALGDLDNDGLVDMVISHMNEPVAVLRNVARTNNHWLGLELAGVKHADVVGARVVLEAGGRKQTRFAKGGGSYASAPDRRFVFGLASTDRIDKVTVYWPNGKSQEWSGLTVDRYYVLEQGEKDAKRPRGQK